MLKKNLLRKGICVVASLMLALSMYVPVFGMDTAVPQKYEYATSETANSWQKGYDFG